MTSDAMTPPEPTAHQVILPLLVEVAREMPRLNKDANNQYANYRYVSIDTYYDLIASRLIAAGINWVLNEVANEVMPDNKHVRFRYEVNLFHVSGHYLSRFSTLSIVHPIQGAQTAGSALSYADKCWMRQLFKIPTGEGDADILPNQPQQQLPPPPQMTQLVAPKPRQRTRQQAIASPPPQQAVAELPPTERPVLVDPATGEVLDCKSVLDQLDPSCTAVKHIREDNQTPILVQPTDQDASEMNWEQIRQIYLTFMPMCTTEDQLRTFWNDNEQVAQVMKNEAPEVFREALQDFRNRKDALSK